MNFRFLDPAEEEMTEAARIYEDQAVGLGERFLDEVEGCVDLLLERKGVWSEDGSPHSTGCSGRAVTCAGNSDTR